MDARTSPTKHSTWSTWWVVLGLCLFIACLSFKPSEPYLSQYLICSWDTAQDQCQSYHDSSSCVNNSPCAWSEQSSSCTAPACSAVSIENCGHGDYDYCEVDGDRCQDSKCYKHFTEDEVNNEIYPWSTYAYLPFLLVLGPFAEIFSYKFAILFGILGRVATRILLLYGRTLGEMQIMQVAYSLGTAAEDVFSAYVYYVIGMEQYQAATSYIKTAALMACVVSGVLGDILVVEWDISLRVLMWISGVFVWTGFFVGLYVIRSSNNSFSTKSRSNTNENLPRSKSPSFDKIYRTNPQAVAGEEGGGSDELMFFKDSPFVHSRSHSRNHIKTSEDIHMLAAPHRSLADSLEQTDFVKRIFEGEEKASSFEEKLDVFKRQLNYLRTAFQSYAFTTMLILWIIGNAVFSILYNYEVAIYEQLNGSNDWNGSVLAIMLMAGSIGAMLPTWLHTKASPLASNRDEDNPGLHLLSGGFTVPDSEQVVCLRLLLAGGFSGVFLVLFVLNWSLILSITFLALFFASWQYINAVVFSRIAMYLKLAQLHQVLNHKLSTDDFERASRDSNSFNINFLQNFLESSSQDDAEERSNLIHALQRANTSPSAFTTPGSRLSNEPENEGFQELVDPPYSFAVVSVIALNVMAQIVLQSILFSYLEVDLKFACWVFVLVFCTGMAFYFIASLIFFGASSLLGELRHSVIRRGNLPLSGGKS